ncbi:MAG TPA: AAA family ATPase [Baekduia sp.]|uniref:AAA family ATPase n=1 Tax=Baekduia sp. TaxID=2600305 RepID=UPI002D76C2A3|nr:AAA family ATPase [Baekduia sp.]HET6507503.1 AAA family ATPase [Baekduia sp.]
MELIGRDAELVRLRGLVDGGAGALVVAGRPGVGKSALLAAAVAGAERLLHTTGVQSEIALPFAGLRELLEPVLDAVDALPQAQRRALRAALALDEPNGLDRGMVLHALVALAGELAPIVVAVDDVQWLDASSREAVAFLARRAQRTGIAVLAVRSLRGEPLDGWPELPTLTLGELRRGDALDLTRRSGVAPVVAEALVEALGGNPLALVEGPTELTAAQRAGREALPDLPSAGERITDAYALRLSRLPRATRAALLMAAASTDGATGPLAAALAGSTGLAAFGPAEDDGLVSVDQRVVRFAHPEARAAVYHAAAPSDRRAAHRALAAVLPGDARAWHLAVAADRPDEALAATLERSAYDAAARGAPGTALHGLRRAAALSPDPVRGRARALAAGHLALVAGHPQTALALASDLPPAPDSAARADTQLLVGAATAQAGQPAEAHALLEAEADRVAATDPGRAAALLTQATIAVMGSGPTGLIARIAARARELAGAGGQGSDLVPAMMEASARAVAGEHDVARAVLGGRLDEIVALDPAAPGHQVIALAGMCLHWIEEQDAAVRLIAPVVQTLRERGAVTPLAFPLVVLASVHCRRGDFHGARELAREAAGLGEEAIGDFLQALTLNTRAFVAAYLGEDDVCVANAQQARAICERLGIYSHRAVAEQALGMLALSQGRLPEAIAHLERGREHRLRYGAHDPGYMFNESDLTEAYARAGRIEDAARTLDELRDGAALTGGAWATAATARYAALLDGDDAIDGHLAAATAAHARVSFAFEEARTKLIFGERLRRARRRTEALALLAEAHAAFAGQGAVRWADRAGAELAAAGAGPPVAVGDPGAVAGLTAREREVCALVAGGATNVEVAAALFLSPRTVEHHLRHIYRKVGVRSRSELAARFAPQRGETPAASRR